MTTQKTLKNKRIYLQYIDEKGDKTTLSFRNDKSMNEHLVKNKIAKSHIKYCSSKRPHNADISVSQISTPRMYTGGGGAGGRGGAGGGGGGGGGGAAGGGGVY